MTPNVIALNEWLMVIDKPAGLIVHSDGRTEEPTLADWIGTHFPKMQGVGGAWVSPQGESIPLNGLIHRLDRSTSGIILVAKTEEAFRYFKDEFKNRRVDKKYLALIGGVPATAEGKIVAEIMRSSIPPKHWYARACEITDPRAAITEWQVLDVRGDHVLVEAYPKTGRTHQIRVHFASVGHPLLGDALYGGNTDTYKIPALHALSISLFLPNAEKVSFFAQPPEYFARDYKAR